MGDFILYYFAPVRGGGTEIIMCTAATYKTKDFYFGRTLDYECSYGEQIVITPRNFELKFINCGILKSHYAFIGTAHVAENYPLYYDAVNEKGLAAAGLNFVGNAKYHDNIPQKDNIAQFEFIPWILSRCADTDEAENLIRRINITGTPFNAQMPAAQLHWIIADKKRAITLESVKDGIKIYDNPVGVLTNNPPFDMQMFNLNNFMGLSASLPKNTFSDKLPLEAYSRGMGAMGLPGDLSSQSRFVRAAFVKANSLSDDGEEESVNQFFHILGAVEQQRGCCEVEKGKYEITIYTSCCNAEKGIYYYTTYNNSRITAVDMKREDLDGKNLICYEQLRKCSIERQN